MLTRAEKLELLALDEERSRRAKRRRLFSYTPYPKQLEFHEKGAVDRERLLMAGNQLGKTLSAGFECAMHLTGLYPKPGQIFYPDTQEMREHGIAGRDVYPNGWQGKRFDKPIWMWASSVSGEATCDNPQRYLVGDPALEENWGTGAIPGDLIRKNDGSWNVDRASQPQHALDAVRVKHVSGGTSLCQFKSYSQGREKWQGPSIDLVWLDEECPLDIYMEGQIMRVLETISHLLTSLGYSNVDTENMVLTIALPRLAHERLNDAINRELHGFEREGKPVDIRDVKDFRWRGCLIELVQREDI